MDEVLRDALMDALHRSDIHAFEGALKDERLHASDRDSNTVTVLAAALERSNRRAVWALLDAGLPLYTELETQLPRPYSLAGYALEHGHDGLAIDLVKRGSKVRPLMTNEKVEALANAFAQAPTRDVQILKRLTEGTQSRYASSLFFNLAATAADIELCRALVKAGVPLEEGPYVTDQTLALPPLHLAARLGEPELAELCIDARARISDWDRLGLTALHQALQAADRRPEACAQIIRLLLARGANPNTLSRAGRTASQDALELPGARPMHALLDDERLQKVPGYVKAARRAGIKLLCFHYDKADGLIWPIAYPDQYWGVGGDHGGTYPATPERALSEMTYLAKRGMNFDWLRPFALAAAEGRDFDLNDLLAHKDKFKILRHGERSNYSAAS